MTSRSRKAVTPKDVHSYLLVHGSNADAKAGANFLQQLSKNSQWPKPSSIVAGPDAQTSAEAAATVFGLDTINTDNGFVDYSAAETAQQFETRSEKAYQTAVGGPGVPLIVAHRSTTAFLDHRVRTQSADDWHPNYAQHALLRSGGVLAATQTGLTPLFRPTTPRLMPMPIGLPAWTSTEMQQTPRKATMDPLMKSVDATVRPVESENPNGEFMVLLSKDNFDRDGDNLWADEWMHPLPEKIHMDTDHAFAKGLSVPYTAGSGIPQITENGDLMVKGTYAGTSHGQLTRQLVNEGHIWQTSVTYQLHQKDDGRIVRELLNGTFTGVPANPEAVVLSSKSSNSDSKPYGNVRYADPGYQSDNKPRYPIDTEEHVRAALSYFGQQKNREKYTSQQSNAILGRIRSRARALGITLDNDKKALVMALCKSIEAKFSGPSVSVISQTDAARTQGNQDVGARSVYDDNDNDGDDDEYDSDLDSIAQAVHDAACTLGAQCSVGDGAKSLAGIEAAMKSLVGPVFHSHDYSINVAGAPGKEVYTLSRGDAVLGHGNLADLTEKSKGSDKKPDFLKDDDDEKDKDSKKSGDADDKDDAKNVDDKKDDDQKDAKKSTENYVLRLPNGNEVVVELPEAAIKALTDAQTSHGGTASSDATDNDSEPTDGDVATKNTQADDKNEGQSSPVDTQTAARSGASQDDIQTAADAANDDQQPKDVAADAADDAEKTDSKTVTDSHPQTLPQSADKTPAAAAEQKAAAAGVTPADLAARATRAKARLRKFQFDTKLTDPEAEAS